MRCFAATAENNPSTWAGGRRQTRGRRPRGASTSRSAEISTGPLYALDLGALLPDKFPASSGETEAVWALSENRILSRESNMLLARATTRRRWTLQPPQARPGERRALLHRSGRRPSMT